MSQSPPAAENRRLLPPDFDDDRIFYLHIDPLAILHELLSLFYRKYRELLKDRMFLIELSDNQIELNVGKGNETGYIIGSFDNLDIWLLAMVLQTVVG
ncbi:hypothetical protein HN51_063699 [Arachis hypogaea]